MNTTLQLFKTLRKDITIIFILCIATITSIDFWLKNIPELFNGGGKIGDIIYKLCLSYISAFIFYFLVVHIKTQRDKANLYKYVTQKVDRIIGCCLGEERKEEEQKRRRRREINKDKEPNKKGNRKKNEEKRKMRKERRKRASASEGIY